MVERRTTLQRRINNARAVQAIYMPCTPALIAASQQGTVPHTKDIPEDECLYLPSQINVESLEACEPGLADIKNCLREGQMRDSLDKLRIQLHIKSRLVNFKVRNVRHQGANTRANKKLQDNEAKIVSFAEKYRAAWSAKLALAGQAVFAGGARPSSLVDAVEEALRDLDAKPLRREGAREGRWVLLDYGDIVVHVQHEEERAYYELERLWKDCPVVDLGLDAPGGEGATP